jgi:hypothetical protein
MSRYARRVDGNHVQIAAAFAACGCSVLDLARLGGGVPDLLICRNGRCVLVEVKKVGVRGGMTSGARRSLQGEVQWAEKWRGCPVYLATGLEAVEAIVGALAKGEA